LAQHRDRPGHTHAPEEGHAPRGQRQPPRRHHEALGQLLQTQAYSDLKSAEAQLAMTIGLPNETAFTLQEAPMPHGSHGDIGIDRAVVLAARHGMTAPWVLSLPAASGAPYLFSRTIRRAEDGRALYLDAGSGRVLQDARFPGFGAGAKVVEWGIATHKGEEYGEPNRLLMLFGCIAVVLLSITGAAMWWKRRAPGTLAAPSRHPDRHAARALLVMMAAAGVLFPLTGLTMLVALGIEGFLRMARTEPLQL